MLQAMTGQGEPIKKAPIKDGRIAVYDIKTGKQEVVHAIDAKERVATGDWSYTAPEQESVIEKSEKPKRSGKKSEK